MLLSCSAKKVTKEGGIGEALRKGALPYVPLPPHRRPVFKNVPIFEHLQLKSCKFFHGSLPKIGTFSGGGWRCGGGFQRGRIFVAPLWLTSLVTFLFSNKKVTYRIYIDIYVIVQLSGSTLSACYFVFLRL